ncbi:hypothetical protein COV81_05045 [Candidatus Peregrinibacteria bacterium CG11_big_fil_rev_8_21_14_0_20_41_10]|nr:MAG: hypothetical protein COV81_05045 [Candidatus Peregrinibacteria bacterium CG11_big_fil_rev_8_21_14_0_20_41_10]PIZ76194.1 MAG: hypothetical protein COY06_02210 [Candidatus Peregrinibacteria bacterium CG_4_10_14_0_2_um_filter_41_8]PJC37695.1 MAG: hypothetical protein CO045_04360 [Candidatus Peregrinibacteria bacterium CG_4_9_14_0_2_um_filter_41_14]
MQFAGNNTSNIRTLNLPEILRDLFIVLNDREKNVLVRRFALGNTPKETLESIGKDLTVTRERVRQIENLALKKLRRTCPTTAFHLVNQLSNQLLQNSGGILSEKGIINKLLQELTHTTEAEKPIIQLSLEINPEITKIKKSKNLKTSWHLKSLKIKDIKTIINSAVKTLKTTIDNIVVEESDFIKQVQQDLATQKLSVNPKTIQSTISIDKRIKLITEGYGLTKWRHVQPKSIRDKALIILRRQNKPLHFIEIANKIGDAHFSKKQVTTQAVHNELIRYDDFILVGRGLYALREWGYIKGTVKEVLTNILAEAPKPMKKQDIIAAVLERRHVKIGTISLNLQKYPQFERIDRALYRYNEALEK